MARYSDARAELDALLETLTPKLAKAFTDLVQDVVSSVVLRDVIAAIEGGDLVQALRAIGLEGPALRPMVKIIEDAFESGGVRTGGTFPKKLNTPNGKTVFRFDVRNSRAEAWLRDNSSQLIVKIEDDVRKAVQSILQAGMVDGRNPRDVALDIVGRVDSATGLRTGGIVGLAPNQVQWVARARSELQNLDPAYLTRKLRDKRFDSIVQAAIDAKKPLDAATLEKLVTRYSERVLKYRGDTIARTEMARALNRSEYEAISQAVDMGAINKSDVKRVWDSSGNDGRTRPSHLRMEGQTVELDEPFTFPGGGQAMYPGDYSLDARKEELIQCRCKARSQVDWIGEALRGNVSDEDKAAIRALANDPLDDDAWRTEPFPKPKTPNAAKDTQMKNYVVSNGIRTQTEYLQAYDTVSGYVLPPTTSGQKSHVAFSDEFDNMLKNPDANFYLHHNHPSSGSFSPQDIYMLHSRLGMRGVWAHGHNGSSYYAERGNVPLDWAMINIYRKNVESVLSEFYHAKKLSEDGYASIFSHVLSLVLQQAGHIDYKPELKAKSGYFAAKYETVIRKTLEKMK